MKNNNIIDNLNKMIPTPLMELIYFDDFSLLISIMLSAQTTDIKVNEVTKILFDRFKDYKSIKQDNFEEIKSIINPIGLANIKAQNIINIVKILNNSKKFKVPLIYDQLIKLPGIGNKSAKVFLVEKGLGNYFPVDTHVKRLSSRLGISLEKDNVEEVEEKLTKYFKNQNLSRLHQQFVLFGRYTCLARSPKCNNCLLQQDCKYYKDLKIK